MSAPWYGQAQAGMIAGYPNPRVSPLRRSSSPARLSKGAEGSSRARARPANRARAAGTRRPSLRTAAPPRATGVGLPVGLAERLPCLGYGPPGRPVVLAMLARALRGGQRPEGGHFRLPAAVLAGDGPGPAAKAGRRRSPAGRACPQAGRRRAARSGRRRPGPRRRAAGSPPPPGRRPSARRAPGAPHRPPWSGHPRSGPVRRGRRAAARGASDPRGDF